MKVRPDACLPTKAHGDDAAFDLYASTMMVDCDGNITYGLGVALEIPKGYVGYIYPRSSNCKKDLVMANSVGIIDSGYRGEISAKFKPSARYVWTRKRPFFLFRWFNGIMRVIVPHYPRIYEVGDRVAQIIVRPLTTIEFEYSDKLSLTARGAGGYGSSGR